MILAGLLGNAFALDEAGTSAMFHGLTTLTVPVDHLHASIQPGLVAGPEHPVLVTLVCHIPFGGPFHLYGGLGRGKDPNDEGGLSQFQLGFGYHQFMGASEKTNYILNARLQSLKSLSYESMVLSFGGIIEYQFETISLGGGVALNSLSYQTEASEVYPETDELEYVLTARIIMRSPYINAEVNTTFKTISLGLSWTLKLED